MPTATLPKRRSVYSTCSVTDFFNMLDYYCETEGVNAEVACDTESNGQDVRDGRGYLTGISLSFKLGPIYQSIYIPLRHPSGNVSFADRVRVQNWFRDYRGWLIFHNAKFDLVNLSTAGIEYLGKFYDTMIICHLLDENLFSKSLDACVRKYVPGEDTKKNTEAFNLIIKHMGWDGISPDDMREYAEHDAFITLCLWEERKAAFEAEELGTNGVWDHKQEFTRVLIKMEGRGVRINQALAFEQAQIGTTRLEELTKELKMNPSSGKDLERVFLKELELPEYDKKTKGGKPAFDKEAMEYYDAILERRNSPLAKKVKEFRGWQKTVGSNYRAYLRLLSPDGRLRPNYKMHGTRTGRLSCEDPNLQQIPRQSENIWNGNLKGCFIADEGYELWEFDYSQLELRLGTAYAREQNLLVVFADPERDVFTEMSQDLGFSRQDTKTLVYSIQYGAGLKRIAAVFGVSLDRARAIKNKYHSTYPGFVKVENMAKARCKSVGKIKLWSGRYRHFWDKYNDAHKAFNSVIQGGAADIVERQMVRLFKAFDSDECRMLLTVHDSVVWEIRKDKVAHYKPLIEEMMANIEPDFGVKFKVEAKEWGKAA